MRIVGGEFGGRRFNPPAKIPARPTTEVAKEGLFNILNNMLDFDGLKTCDLFGGTGSISYELASRGAIDLTLIERDNTTIRFIKQTINTLGIEDKVRVINGDVFIFMKQSTEQYDFIFAGPPYALEAIDTIPEIIFEKICLQKKEYLFWNTHRETNTNLFPILFRPATMEPLYSQPSFRM